MKKIIFFILTVLIVYLIYIIKKDDKIQYLVLGNPLSTSANNELVRLLQDNNKYENSILEFQKEDSTIAEILNNIKNNKKVINNSKQVSINNALVRSELIIINIDYPNTRDLSKELEILLSTVKHITKEQVVLYTTKDICKLVTIPCFTNSDELKNYVKNAIMK